MAYLGHKPAVGENNSFRILDDISSFVLTFDGSSASAVGLSDETITMTENNHRFITGQRVTYSNGGGGNITGLVNGQAYFVINHSKTQIKLANSASNALAGTAVNLTGLGTGSSHTLTLAFDGINTKFDPTFGDGMHDTLIKRAAQLVISINGVIQQPHDTATPSTGFGVDSLGHIIFSTAPASTDIFWGHILATNTVTFDSSDNDVDTFTGNGSTTSFTLSKIPPDNRNILVTIDGVVQYPSDAANTRSYSVSENVMTFVAAPGLGTVIQVRHIGYAGLGAGGGGGVTGFYGRVGNVSLQSTDNIVANNATFNGNVSIAQTLTYEDVTDIDSVGLITARSGIKDQTLTAGHVVFAGTGGRLSGEADLFYNSSTNRLGIGTTNPGALLNVYGSPAELRLQHDGNSSYSRIISDSDNQLNIYTGGGPHFAMRIDGSQRVGIGTTNPLYPLHVKGATTNTAPNATGILMGLQHEYAAIQLNAADTKGSLIDFSIPGQDRKGGIQYLHSNNPTTANRDAMLFYTNGTNERFRIASDGKIGINTTPSHSFEVFTGADHENIIQVKGTNPVGVYAGMGVYQGNAVFTGGGIGTNSAGLVFRTAASGSEVEKLRITSTGQVQLNGATGKSTSGTSATDLLMANGAAIRFRRANDSNWINTIGIDSSDNLKLGWGGSVDEIHFGIAGIGQQMTLDSSGNLLIGRTAWVDNHFDNGIYLAGSTQAGMKFMRTASGSAGTYDIGIDTDRAFKFVYAGDSGGTGTERFRIDSNGHFKVTTGSTSDFNTIQRASTSNYSGIRIQDADATQRMQIGVAGGTNNIANGAAQHDVVFKSYANLLLATNQTEQLRITSQGRIGLNGVVPTNSHANVTSSIHLADSNTILSRTGNQYFALYQNLKQTNADVTRYLVDGYASAYAQNTGTHRFYTVGNGTGNTNATVYERLRITNVGNALFGGTGVSQTNRQLVVGSDAEANLAIETHNTSASETANIRFYRSRGTAASPTTLVDNDVISNLLFYGHDGTDYAHAAAMIRVECDGTVAGNQMPGAMSFHTNAGTTSATERLRITSDGKIGIGHHIATQITKELTIRPADGGGILMGRPGDTVAPINVALQITTRTSGSEAYHTEYHTANCNAIFATHEGGGTGGNLIFQTGVGSGNDVERMRIDSSGRVVVGGSSAYIGGAALAVLGTGNTPNTYGSFAIGKIGANPTAGTTLANIRLNGGSVGTRRGAEINAKAANNWTDGSSHPTTLSFAVAKDGTASVTDRVIINHYGHFQVTNENALPSGSTVGGTNGFKGLSQHGYQHWGQRQYYSGQRNLTEDQYFDLFSNNTAHDDIIFWLNIKGYHSNRTFATAHGTMGGYGLSVSYQSASGVYGNFSLVDIATGRRKLRWTSTSPNSANWWIWGWFSGTAYTTTHTGWAAGQLH